MKLEKMGGGGSESLMKLVKDANGFLGQLE